MLGKWTSPDGSVDIENLCPENYKMFLYCTVGKKKLRKKHTKRCNEKEQKYKTSDGVLL